MERRLTTILTADVVGYSRLMRVDEAGTLAALKVLRRDLFKPKEAQYRGRTVKLMGDGALMEFSSVVDAVRFAAEVQSATAERNKNVPEDQRIVFRIGINIGDIIVEGDDIYGDGVNVASRLERLAEPGGICVARNVYSQVKDKLDLTFQNLGEKEVKNIPEPVTVYRMVVDAKAKALVTPVVETQRKVRFPRSWHIAAALAITLLVIVGLFWWQAERPELEPASMDRMALPLPDKPSLAVLPFNNLNGDAKDDYFADGITEDLITDLAKLSGIFVISRNSSWTYKDKPVKPQQVAEEFGVRYVLEGSIRRQGDQVRINAQLIDAINGYHIWAERYDGAIDDVFALQDKVINEIVSALAIGLTHAEELRIGEAETTSFQAYDAVLQGFESLRLDTEDGTNRAIALFETAIEHDPNYGRAYAGLASAYWRFVLAGWTTTAGYAWEQKLDLFNRHLADALQHPTSLAHAVSAQFLMLQSRYDEAFVEIDRAMALAPNDPDNHISKAKILNATGHAEGAEEAARYAMRIDPRFSPESLRVLAVSQFNQKKYQEARETMERVVNLGSENPEDYATLAATLGHLGEVQEAYRLIEKYNELAVAYYLEPYSVQEAGWWWYGDIYGYYDPFREAYQEGLRKAGVPEGAGTDLSRADYMRFVTKEDGEFRVAGAPKIDVQLAHRLVEEGNVKFIDVRAPAEFAVGHIPGAVNLSVVSALSSDRLSDIVDKDDPVTFYCHGKHCFLSAYAAAKALAWGLTEVYYFADGFPAWTEAGLPVEAQTQ